MNLHIEKIAELFKGPSDFDLQMHSKIIRLGSGIQTLQHLMDMETSGDVTVEFKLIICKRVIEKYSIITEGGRKRRRTYKRIRKRRLS